MKLKTGKTQHNNRNDKDERPGAESPLSGAELVNPYDKDGRKGVQVEKMFDSIAPAYDFMNTAMTMGLHHRWRDRALRAAAERMPAPSDILDIATGTGDVAIRMADIFRSARVTGVDLSRGMLKLAKQKLYQLPPSVGERVQFEVGDSLALQYSNRSFDLVTVAYGVRNFEHLVQGLDEMHRVLRPGGTLCIVELSVPVNPVVRSGYNLYSRHIIPAIGRMVSGDSKAYTYLPQSIAAAPQRDDMALILRKCGFRDIQWRSLTLGAVTYYLASKPR